MDVRVGDLLEMKKPHPCGCKQFLVIRAGMDFKIRCQKCARLIENIRRILRDQPGQP